MPPPVASSSCVFEFAQVVPMDEAASTFQLALLATESLHGVDRVALEAVYKIDPANHTIEVDRTSVVGSTLTCVLLGYLRREYEPGAFRMRRVQAAASAGDQGGDR